jgi:hypothetical protein
MRGTTSFDDPPGATGRWRAVLLACACLAALPARGFLLEDTYSMSTEQRTWYFAGVYDSWLTDPRYATCATRLRFDRFMQAMGRFIESLPADAAAPARRSADSMPAASVAQLVIAAECAK